MRLDKYLSGVGLTTRSKVRLYLAMNDVFRDGMQLRKPDIKLKEGDILLINRVEYKVQTKQYFILNKPAGYVSALKDREHKCITEFFPKNGLNLKIVGRLDKDTVGCILLTNDGDFAHKMINGNKEIKKVYLVDTKDKVDQTQIDLLSKPIEFEKYTTKPGEVVVVSDKQIKLTISEGKHHQVKKMLISVGNEVTKLERLSVGPYSCEGLKQGQFKELSLNNY